MRSKGILVMAIIGTMLMSSVTAFGNEVVIKAQNGMYQPDHVILLLTGQKQLTVTWKKVKGASGYVITQNINGEKGNKTVAVIGKNSTKYVAKNLKKNRVYSFTVKAYKWKNNKKLYSKTSRIKGYTGLKKPGIYDRTTSANKITAIWNTGEITSKAQIYRSEKKNGRYKKVAVVKSKISSFDYTGGQMKPVVSATYRDTNVKMGKTYYYKARSFKKFGNRFVYSKYSKVKTLSAKNAIPQLTGQIYTSQGTTGDVFDFAVTSNPYNYNADFYMDYKYNDIYFNDGPAIKGIKYSTNGKDYRDANKKINIAPGQKIYFRITVSTKMIWNGKTVLMIDGRYGYTPSGTGAIMYSYDLSKNEIRPLYFVSN